MLLLQDQFSTCENLVTMEIIIKSIALKYKIWIDAGRGLVVYWPILFVKVYGTLFCTVTQLSL